MMKRHLGYTTGLAFAACCLSWSTAAAEPRVVATIKPVHSLVAGVMEGVGTPSLLIQGGASPHSYSLRPSEARALSQADLVFWIGEDLETFLEKPLEALAKPATVVTLSTAPGVKLLDSREAGTWEAHGEHGDHDEAAHDEHGHDEHGHDEHAKAEHGDDDHDHDAHGHDEHAKAEHDDHDDHGHGEHAKAEHDDHDDHGHGEHAKAEHDDHDHEAHGHDEHAHGEHNLHIWLGPENAQAIVRAAAAALSAADPEHAARYESNAKALLTRIERESGKIAKTLAPVSSVPYVVFHDAYPYFEQHFGMNAVGSITVSPERKPGAKRLGEIRKKIVDLGAVCVFSEPQFQPALVDTVIEGTAARAGSLDPLGADIAPGPEAYFKIMTGLAEDLRDCLAPAS